MGLTEESHPMICRTLIQEVKDHISDYMRVFVSDESFNYILNGLYPPKNSVVVELTNHEIGILEKFYPIRGRPPLSPNTNIMCLSLIPKHFFLIYF